MTWYLDVASGYTIDKLCPLNRFLKFHHIYCDCQIVMGRLLRRAAFANWRAFVWQTSVEEKGPGSMVHSLPLWECLLGALNKIDSSPYTHSLP